MKTQIAVAFALLLLMGCSKEPSIVEPITPSQDFDYFKYQLGGEWVVVESRFSLLTESCDIGYHADLKDFSMSKKQHDGRTLTVGFQLIEQNKPLEVGNYPLVKNLYGGKPGIELYLNQPLNIGYERYSTALEKQLDNGFFRLTDITVIEATARISGEFMAILNNGGIIKGSFRVSVPKEITN